MLKLNELRDEIFSYYKGENYDEVNARKLNGKKMIRKPLENKMRVVE